MDGRNFDDLTRRLASGASRRSLFKAFLGGIGGLVATTITRGSAGAQPSGRPARTCGGPCQSGACNANLTCEGTICVPSSSDFICCPSTGYALQRWSQRYCPEQDCVAQK